MTATDAMADQLISTAVIHELREAYFRPEAHRPCMVKHIPLVNLARLDRATVVSQIGAAGASHGFFQVLKRATLVELVQELLAHFYDPAKKNVHSWGDYFGLHCHPPEQFVPDRPANPPPFRTFNDEITDDLIFSVASSQEGGIDTEVGSSTMHMQKHCSVSQGAPLNSGGYGGSKMSALVIPQPRRAGDGGSSSTGTLMPRLWLDSGATHHVVGDDIILTNLRDLPAGMVVTVANGSQLPVTKVGDIQTPDIEIEDVYHVPGLEMDLVSVRQLAKSKIVTTFYENHAELWLAGRQIGGAIIDDAESLYRLRFLLAPCLHAIARHAASA